MTAPTRQSEPEVAARRHDWLFGKFAWASQRLVRRRFHAVRVLRDASPFAIEKKQAPLDPDWIAQPGVVCMNHPAWWDPMAAVVAAQAWFPGRQHFAPIDQDMLGQYPLFKRLGFFGVETGTARGGAKFMKTALGLLNTAPRKQRSHGGRVLWVTAQGTFQDVRDRPIQLMPGVSRLAGRLARRDPHTLGGAAWILPMAVEYAFWEESKPEMLFAFAKPMTAAQAAEHDALEAVLTRTMDQLAVAVRRRDAAAFEVVLGGSAGVGGGYDVLRRMKALAQGRRFDPRHGSQSTQGTTP